MCRIAVVTGASRGIGKAISERLTSDSWLTFNLDISPPEVEDGMWIETDISDPKAITAGFDKARKAGPITGLVNNAAVALVDRLEDSTLDDFERTMAINLRAPMICAQTVMKEMKTEGFGRIVNISSRAMLGKTHRTTYGASKGGIAAMSRVWALELAQYGITVNTIAPGPIATDMFTHANPPDMPRTQEIIGTIPAGRLGTPDDIAQAVAFFMDERSSFINGQLLYVCGGITLARGGS